MLEFRYGAASHPGLVRDNNEDAGYAGSRLLLIADGVGGAPAGEVASASATCVVTAVSAICTGEPLAVLQQAVTFSFQHLRQGAEHMPSRQGMSTTLTAILTDGERFGVAHLGDSRGFILRNGRCQQITTDHTLVQLMIDSGQLTEAEASGLPFRAIIAKSLTADGVSDPDLFGLDLTAGDRVLLASDGLTDLVAADVIGETMAVADLDSAVDQLVGHALSAGGRDNVTCILGELVETDAAHPGGEPIGAAADPENLIDQSAVSAVTQNGRQHAVLRELESGGFPGYEWPDSQAG
jgi:protein phosphatase